MSGYVSPFPATNELFGESSARQRQYLTNDLLSQQTIGAADTEMAARIAQSLVATNDEAKAAQMYPGMIAEAQGRGFLKNAPTVWPGMERARAVALLAVPVKDQYDRQANQAGWDQITGGGGGTTAPGPGAAAASSSGTAAPRSASLTTTEPETGLPVVTRPAAAPGTATTLADIHPNLTTIRSPNGAKLTVSADAAPRFQGLIDDLHAEGYTLDPATTGGYNARNIAGTNTPSQHAYGSAIDINWQLNPRGANTPSDIPPDLARRLAAKHGLTWGGDWKGDTRDPMHFEVARGGPQAPTGGVAARTGGTDVAGPGAGPTAPQGATQGGGGGMLAGLTPQQEMAVRALRLDPKKTPADGLALIQHFRERNEATAHQAQQEALAARNEERQLRQEQARIDQQAIVNAREAVKAKQEAALASLPFHGNAADVQNRNILIEGTKSDKTDTVEYASAYADYATEKRDAEGRVFKPDMTPYKDPTGPAYGGGKGGRELGKSDVSQAAIAPDKVNTAMFGNLATLRNIDNALKELDAHPDSIGLKALQPDWLIQRTDPEGVALRADIADILSGTFHERSGAAVTVNEAPRMKPFTPSAIDTAASLRTKLERMRNIVTGILTDHYDTYGPKGSFRAIPGVEDALKSSAPKSGGRPPLSSFQK